MDASNEINRNIDSKKSFIESNYNMLYKKQDLLDNKEYISELKLQNKTNEEISLLVKEKNNK
jgi:hypothetical protein